MAQIHGNSGIENLNLERCLSDTVHAKMKWLGPETLHNDSTTPEADSKTHKVIKEVEVFIVKWLRSLFQERCTENASDTASSSTDSKPDFGIRLEIFGGHLLGVALEESDVDVICVIPGFVKHEDFFTKLPSLMTELDNFKQIRVVSGARVPLIECHTDSVKVDLLLCIIQDCVIVPDDLDLLNDNCLSLMDTTSVYSVNGYRETMTVVQIVPNKDTFILALKAVKLWAKCQHIHHASLGFLGGISWALLVAYICLYHRDISVDQILHKFFVTFSNWELRKAVHIMPLQEGSKLNIEPWNPRKNYGDSLHEWPIITPIYPAHNTAFSVSPFTFAIMKSLLAKAASVTEKVLSHEMSWEELFKSHFNMFSHYKHFLIITAWATNAKDAFDWLGLLESQIRLLFLNLSKKDVIKLIHPYTEKLSPLNPRLNNEKCWVAGLKVDKSHGNLNIAQNIQDFKTKVFSLSRERDIYREGMQFDVKYIKRSQLLEMFHEKTLGGNFD